MQAWGTGCFGTEVFLSMTHRDTSFAAYRPWGHVRRRNLIGRVLYAVSMAVLGLGALAGVALLAVFAASVALAASFAVAVVGFYATLRHKPAHVRVRASEQASGKGVYTARKSGSTWTVY